MRAYWIAEELERHGVESTLVQTHSRFDLLLLALRLLFYRVVVFQKCYSRWHVLLARWARLLGKIVVFDIDDAPSRNESPVTLRNCAEIMKLSHLVLAGCQKLVEYAAPYQANVLLLPSTVKMENYRAATEVEAQTEGYTLGWIGNGAHYCDDLVGILAEPLAAVAQKQPIKLKIVGACGQERLAETFGKIDGLELELVDQIDWASPTATADAMRGVDVGLYPLLENNFNPYKCGFKALEYMALGIPVLASPVSVSADIVRHGFDGYVCASSSDWELGVMALLNDSDLRSSLGEQARHRVEGTYSSKSAAETLIQQLRLIT